MIFCQLDMEIVMNLRAILLCFQAVSGLNINLEKSEMVRIGKGAMKNTLLVYWDAVRPSCP